MATSFGLGNEPIITEQDLDLGYSQEDLQKAVQDAGYFDSLDAPEEFSNAGAISQLEQDLMSDILLRDVLGEEEALGKRNLAAMDEDDMAFNTRVAEHLEEREGFKDHSYLDNLLKPTAGTGHLLSKEEQKLYPEGTKIPLEVLQGWFIEDSQKAKDAAKAQIAEIPNQSNRDLELALVSVNYQLGTGWTKKFPTAWKHLKGGNWESAIEEIELTKAGSEIPSDWKKQTPKRVKDFVSAIKKQYA